jgi:glycosyltransferase involved in cell wall biosynthesis
MSHITMILTNPYLPDPRAHKEASCLVEHGHEVTVLALDYRNRARDRPIETLDGVEIRRFFTSPATVSNNPESWEPITKVLYRIPFFWHFENFRHQLRFIRKLREYFAQHRTDYLHGHDLSGAWLATKLKLDKVPIVFDMHEEYLRATPKKALLAPFTRLFYHHIQNRVDHLIYIHPAQIEDITAHNRDKLVFLPNYPEASGERPLEHIRGQRLRLAYIGTILLDTYELHRKVFEATRGLDVEILIYGKEIEGFPFAPIAAEYPQVRLMGPYDYRTDLPRIYQSVDLTYLLYDYQNMGYRWNVPNKFYEALRFQAPFIVEHHTAMADFADAEKVGFSVDTYDVEALRLLITRLIDNPSLVEAARNRMTEQDFATTFTWEKCAESLLPLYDDGLK